MIRPFLLILFFFVLAFSSCKKADFPEKKIIGATAIIHVGDNNYSYLSRVDTGAASTSIHALNIKVIDGAVKKTDNIGKMVQFDTLNDMEIKKTFTAEIIDVDRIKNPQGIEERYRIKMKIGKNGHFKEVPMNLRDRTGMSYMLLIGRSFLQDDYLVDVSKSEDMRK